MPKKPIRQGELDGLCGLYSVINALNNMLPAYLVNGDIRKELFEIGITHLDEKEGRLRKTLFEGMYSNVLQPLIHAYKPYIAENFGYTLKVEKITKDDADIRRVWNNISEYLDDEKNEHSESNAVIVSLGGKHDHWSTIIRTTEKTWHMIDSDGIKAITKKDLTTSSEPYGDKSICIVKGDVLGLSFKKIKTA